jgi:hypothetical protein
VDSATDGDIDSGADSSSGGAGGSNGTDGSPDATIDATGGSDGGTDASPEVAPPAPKFCASPCSTDEDCLINESGKGFRCHPVRKRCEKPEEFCDTADDCLAFASLWFDPCTSDANCGTRICVDAGTLGGRCAPKPNPTLGNCANFSTEPMMRQRFGDAGLVEVCGSKRGRCGNGRCFIGCTATEGCDTGHGNTCNTETGVCECASPAECTAPDAPKCNATTHHCECGSNVNCALPGMDICVQGTCSCSGAGACPTKFANAPVCE